MAPLTWRNVAPQGFGDSVAAMGLGARSMERGFAGLTEALGNWDTYRTEQNDRNVLAAAQRIQDPTSYREALQNGSILGSIDPSQVSARTLQAVDNRSRTLLDQAVTGYTFDRTRTNDAAMDGNREFLAAMAEASASGDPARIATVRARFPNAMATLPSDQILRIAGQTQGLESGAVGIAGARQSQTQQGERHGWAREDRTSVQAGIDLAESIRSQSRTQELDEELIAEATERGVPSAAIAEARRRLAGDTNRFGTVAGSAGASSPAGRGTGGAGQGSPTRFVLAGDVGANLSPGTQGGSPYDVTYQYRATDRPITSMTIDELQNHQSNMVQTQGHSPVGAYQINRATLAEFAPRVLGENWRSQQFTPEAQERIAEAIYNARRGGDLTGTWAALRGARVPGSTRNANESGAYANVPWSVARTQIMSAEVGAATQQASIARAGTTATIAAELARDVAARRAQNSANTIVPDWDTLRVSRETADEAATRLRQSMSGTSHEDILYGINRLIQYGEANKPEGGRNPINAATAAAILSRNQGASRPWYGAGYFFSRSRDSDWTAMERQADAVLNSDVDKQAGADRVAERTQQTLETQAQALIEQRARLSDTEARAERNPAVGRQLARQIETQRRALAQSEQRLARTVERLRAQPGWEDSNRFLPTGRRLSTAPETPATPVPRRATEALRQATVASPAEIPLPGPRPRSLTDLRPGSIPRLSIF